MAILRKKNFLFLVLMCLAGVSFAAQAMDTSHRYPLTAQPVKAHAQAGDPDAQYAWGYMLYYGKSGIAQNKQEAMLWFHKAASKGQPQAIQALEIIRRAEHPQVGVPIHPKPQVIDPHAPKAVPLHQTLKPTSHTNMPAEKQHLLNHQAAPRVDLNHRVVAPSPAAMPHQAMPMHHHTQPMHASQAAPRMMPQIPPSMFIQMIRRNHALLMKRPSSHYVVQLTASHRFQSLMDYARHEKRLLAVPSLHPLIFYRTEHRGQPWFVLLGGNYATHDEAKHAVALIDHELKSQQPFVKSMRSIQASLAAPSH